jgi:hypothetical protein
MKFETGTENYQNFCRHLADKLKLIHKQIDEVDSNTAGNELIAPLSQLQDLIDDLNYSSIGC